MLTLREIEEQARERLDPRIYEMFAGGTADQITVRANQAAFSRISLLPRVLRGREKRELDVPLLGGHASMPVLVAPTGSHRLVHPDGECATARAAARADTIMIVSMASTVAIEEVAAQAREVTPRGRTPGLWFQLYIQPDLEFTEALVRRAEDAGCQAIVVTVDSPVRGRDFADLPDGIRYENLRNHHDHDRVRRVVWSAEISWEHIDWLRETTTLPILLKGVVHPEDALLAVNSGIDGIVVSNHGGRQLDTVPATIELLAPVADAVGGSVPVLLDGGVRRGTDVIKALALGASAVAVGRPVLWGLAADGEDGVTAVLEGLRAEVDQALALCGCGSLIDLSRDFVRLRGMDDPWFG